ncbi:MAG: 3-oxoacyl-[acyl-carrier-protein] reductase [Rickettsiales bacterium]|nr:3-oxoacyl-[acyl-carrier-protein] reductase [Rickettsiales bacterium]
MFSLEGKKALVTGATGGIGGAVAHALKKAGAELVVSGTRQEKLDELVKELGGATAIACNLKDLAQVDELPAKASEALGGLDIIVCNAGVTKDNLAMRMKEDEWQDVIDINLTATHRLNKAVLRGMMKQKHGRIINVASVVAVMGNPGQTNYCASKAGMIGMSKSLAAEVASRGITVNCVAPGFIKTAMTDALNEDQQTRITANIPSGRFGLPEDIASSVVFLASDEASYITGQTVHINGGLLMV